MQTTEPSSLESLKQVLQHLREPEKLNHHPWAALAAGTQHPAPGATLIDLVLHVFRKTMPPAPPRASKRLDTRWGVFGLLAAQHFAPALRGSPTPTSQKAAWEDIDRSILFFVHESNPALSQDQTQAYAFAAHEIEPAPNSTLSDWYRKGLEQLTNLLLIELEQLAQARSTAARPRRTAKSAGWLLLLLLPSLLLGLIAWRSWTFFQKALSIRSQAYALLADLNPPPSRDQLPQITSAVHTLRSDLDDLSLELEPYLWLTGYATWVPTYAGDIGQARELLSLAQNLLAAADEGLAAVGPALTKTGIPKQLPDLLDLLLNLQDAGPHLLNAQVALAQAQAAREKIDSQRLSPATLQIITSQVDRLFSALTGNISMQDALALVRIAPHLLGSSANGPQSYLILIQNEDELRATGGFITAGGLAVVHKGKLLSINIESSGVLDDFSKPYPLPPWQFKEFMNIDKLVFRDSNWFSDFPRTVSWAEYFYSYTRSASADGVIAVDLHVVLELIKILGPVQVDGVSGQIDAENVVDFMRNTREPQPPGFTGNWDSKQHIGRLAQPLLEKILQARGETWTRLLPVLISLLNEKHILLQFDDEEATRFIQRRNWDGAVRVPPASDFIMVVDSNMGYNKSNAVMEMSLEYVLNLTNLAAPAGLLTIRQANHAASDLPCEPGSTRRFTPTEKLPSGHLYLQDECHWGYLRVYLPGGVTLEHSTPREIPDVSTWLGQTIPARTDDLGSEDIPDAQVYGAMVLTPTRGTSEIAFNYRLPGAVLAPANQSGTRTYQLIPLEASGNSARTGFPRTFPAPHPPIRSIP
ncbi:MAG: DUF4012 domain-containing protein [Chloroflexota bacterium]